MKAEVEGLSDVLRADGGESTYEEIISMAMIEKAMQGNVKAFIAIKDVLGQTSKSEDDLAEQQLRMSAAKAKMGTSDEDEEQDDGFIDALRGSVKDDWAEEELDNNHETTDL